MDALAIVDREIVELGWPPGGRGNRVVGIEVDSGKGTAQAPRGAGDEPDL